MKNFMIFSLALMISAMACAQPQHKASPHDTVSSKGITVTYGRPYKKGREIFGKLEPFGKVYRLGADEATQITFASDYSFGGKVVKAGTYTLFAIPNQKTWTLILNAQLGQWGAFKYDQYKNKDVLRVDLPVNTLPATVEQLTIRFTAESMIIEWDKTQVVVPVRAAVK